MNEMLQRLGEAAKAAASETAKLGVSEKKRMSRRCGCGASQK